MPNTNAFKRAIVTHGGAGSNVADSDRAAFAAAAGMSLMNENGSALDAVVEAVRNLEDDHRFNAGLGSRLRADGKTIQMDASCMTSDGKFGAVACVEHLQNPILVAKEVLFETAVILITGYGVHLFAQEHALELQTLPQATLTTKKNYETPSCDTVGAVAFDGKIYAAALSTGGLSGAPIGRVGDVPLPGCGLFCGPMGAIACTGDGESIALKLLARQVYSRLEDNMNADVAANEALSLFDDTVDIGIIVLGHTGFSARARNGMAWSHATVSN
ncbi:MAG: isoaspartyl peptidase/L-asparaginase [Spirochaetia bacterium]|nr:isoaspartyl peptidase/L-asparaginase [Spirochaetia bacterium]